MSATTPSGMRAVAQASGPRECLSFRIAAELLLGIATLGERLLPIDIDKLMRHPAFGLNAPPH